MVSATMRTGRKGRCDCYSHGANSEVNCGGYSKICDPGRPRREISGLHCFWWGHRKSHSDADAGEGSQRIGVEDEKSGWVWRSQPGKRGHCVCCAGISDLASAGGEYTFGYGGREAGCPWKNFLCL